MDFHEESIASISSLLKVHSINLDMQPNMESDQSPNSSIVNGSSTDCIAKNTAKQDLEFNSLDRASIDISATSEDDKSTLAKQDLHSDHSSSVSDKIEQASESIDLETFGICLTPVTVSVARAVERQQSENEQLV